MRRLRAFAVLIALLAVAGGPRREVVLGGVAFPASLVVVLDVSGSMYEEDGHAIRLALREVRWIARQMTDDGRIRFYTFADAVAEEPHGWITLPDAEKVEAALSWVADGQRAGCNTNLGWALERVLALRDDPLGVVVVTDGEPSGGRDPTVARLRELNAKRRAPAVVGFDVVVRSDQGDEFGRDASAAGGGAYVRVRSPRHDDDGTR